MKKTLIIIFTLFFLNMQAFAQQNDAKKEAESKIIEKLASIKAKKIKIYGFNPVRNPNNLITIVEFNDMSCFDCLNKANGVYNSISDKNKEKVRYIYKHMHSDQIKIINNKAIYALLAAEKNVFWKLKKAFTSKKFKEDKEIIDLLISYGLDKKELSKLLLKNSKKYYSYLDADSTYSYNLDSFATPMFYIDGYRIDEDLETTDLNEYIENTYKNYQESESGIYKYNMGKF